MITYKHKQLQIMYLYLNTNFYHHRCDIALTQCTAGIQTTGHSLSQLFHFPNHSTKEQHTCSVPLICLCKGPRLTHKGSLCQREVEWKVWWQIWLFTHLGWIQNTTWPGRESDGPFMGRR